MPVSPARPQVDRSQLQQLIAGLSEGIVLLDTDGRIVWANAHALSMHDVDSLDKLGGSVRGYAKRFALHYRNHRALAARQYPLARLQAGETFDDVVVQLSRPDDAEFKRVLQMRGLVLVDADGRPESLVLVLTDQTERFNAEDRFERTFAANPAPALICRLSDLRYVKVNRGFTELSGLTGDALIGRSAYEYDVLAGAADREQAIENLHAGRTIKQTEALLRVADGTDRLVIVAGQPLEIGDGPCMLFTFMDLEPRRQAELAQRQTEERFAKAFRLAPVPMMIFQCDELRTLAVNDAFCESTGLSSEQALARTMPELGIWADDAQTRRAIAELRAHGAAKDREIAFLSRSGDRLEGLLSAESATIDAHRCLLCVLQDITERKRSEAELMTAIDAVMQDASWFGRSVIEKLAQLRSPSPPGDTGRPVARLTRREREVLELLCEGLDNGQIAERLHRSLNTVRNHVATLYAKIGVHRRDAAVVWARDRGITGSRQSGRRIGD
ncbi:MAG: PAS domain S-box protein [Burkholderiaceae bacterium]